MPANVSVGRATALQHGPIPSPKAGAEFGKTAQFIDGLFCSHRVDSCTITAAMAAAFKHPLCDELPSDSAMHVQSLAR